MASICSSLQGGSSLSPSVEGLGIMKVGTGAQGDDGSHKPHCASLTFLMTLPVSYALIHAVFFAGRLWTSRGRRSLWVGSSRILRQNAPIRQGRTRQVDGSRHHPRGMVSRCRWCMADGGDRESSFLNLSLSSPRIKGSMRSDQSVCVCAGGGGGAGGGRGSLYFKLLSVVDSPT